MVANHTVGLGLYSTPTARVRLPTNDPFCIWQCSKACLRACSPLQANNIQQKLTVPRIRQKILGLIGLCSHLDANMCQTVITMMMAVAIGFVAMERGTEKAHHPVKHNTETKLGRSGESTLFFTAWAWYRSTCRQPMGPSAYMHNQRIHTWYILWRAGGAAAFLRNNTGEFPG